MPELPEMEALRRALDEPVSAFPIAKAGPAHIATLKEAVAKAEALAEQRRQEAETSSKRVDHLVAELVDGACVCH